jgi:hypothetical protein
MCKRAAGTDKSLKSCRWYHPERGVGCGPLTGKKAQSRTTHFSVTAGNKAADHDAIARVDKSRRQFGVSFYCTL